MIEESIAIANIIPEARRHRDPRRARRELEQRRLRRTPAGMARREPARSRFHHRRRPTGSRRACATRQHSPLRSAPRPGRISSSASCCWSSFTGRRRSCRATPTIADESALHQFVTRGAAGLVLIPHKSRLILASGPNFASFDGDASRDKALRCQLPPGIRGDDGDFAVRMTVAAGADTAATAGRGSLSRPSGGRIRGATGQSVRTTRRRSGASPRDAPISMRSTSATRNSRRCAPSSARRSRTRPSSSARSNRSATIAASSTSSSSTRPRGCALWRKRLPRPSNVSRRSMRASRRCASRSTPGAR